ncbi:hypothetical protein KPH14_007991 [Odynerus spinipes]|uniref:Sperm flagellar protein 2 n=1 Tax=Odynerus spinipes TaxID=1348599 RepID=A0AAD9RK01_9HYME|nr:hypothetical protein KPH14_007991 [Odynerus spinipes]
MGEVLKKWMRQRLGVLMNMTPELFGHHTRDGRLLAQILHSYGIINSDQLETIAPTRDPALCRVNLKHLRVWLRFIGIVCTDQCIEEISCGKGATALQLFYKVYLSLEDKDNLHFITLQKEREKYIPASRKFDVIRVPEEPPPYEPPPHPLSKPLTKTLSSIEWHRNKYLEILRSCQKEKEKLKSHAAKSTKRDSKETTTVLKKSSRTSPTNNFLKELDEFAQKHRVRHSKRDVYDPCQADKLYDEVEIPTEDPEAAKAYISWLKARKRKEKIENSLKTRMQGMLLSELWERLSENQEKTIDESLARRVLDQSHYEKQMITKLGEVRKQKDVITENRRVVDQLILDAKETKLRSEQERMREEFVWESEDVDMEYQRLRELHRRIRKERLKKIREKHARVCLEVLQDLADIAVKAAECRSSNDGCVPKAIWNEWKALFLKCQPIFEPLEEEEWDQEEETQQQDERIEEIMQSRLEREATLNEADFESYHTFGSPWDEYVPPIEPETEEILRLGELVLGYIVHRLLEFVYPYPIGLMESPVPKVKVAAIVLGVVELRLCQIIQALLKKSGIRVVLMENAINYCLSRYKEEMSDVKYIDASIVKATEDILKKTNGKGGGEGLKIVESGTRSKKSSKTLSKSSKASMRRRDREREKKRDAEEKETQTPRVIPYDDMDPVLSDAAYVGKWTYEFLVLGQPISNELNTRILVEYLKSLGEIEGWALIDYPNTYDQMARLERALTGCKVPPDPSLLDFDNVNIEDIDPLSPRIVYEDTEVDDYSSYRQSLTHLQSKLLPNPISKDEDYTSASSFVTTYVRAISKPKNLKTDPNKLVEVLPEDATAVDGFYVQQSVAYVVYYDVFDVTVMKKIARLVTGDKSIPRTPSIELFGDALKSLEERKEWNKLSAKESMVRRLLSKSTVFSKDEEEQEEEEEEEEEMKMEDMEAAGDYVDNIRAPKPGEDTWDWLDLPQSPILLDALATLWENLEEIYILDLMEIFSLKRAHATAVVPYKDFVVRNMREFIKRPDNKQDFLQEFQCKFNDVNEDTRDDDDVKCELHCRLAEFQERLWNFCDLRRQEAEEKRKRIIQEQWTDVEAVFLVNIYTAILQAEIDRCVDTLQMIQDYYTSMLQKPIQETRFSKILLDRVKIHVVPTSFEESEETFLNSMIRNKESKDQKDSKAKVPSTKPASSIPVADPIEFTREIATLFTDVTNPAPFDPAETFICKAIFNDIQYVRNFLESIASTATENLKKEEIALATREKTSRRGDFSPATVMGKLLRRGQDLIQEWRYASLFEINRMRIRLDVLAESARADVTFLLDTMRLTFHRIYEQIIERYDKEKSSVDEVIKVFGFAIEEEVSIQEELVLDGENFYVQPNVLMYPDRPETPPKPTREAQRPSQFRISQLGRLMNVFRVIAPGGTLTERSFVYVLQDMVSYNMEEETEGCDGLGSMPVPFCWRILRSCDVSLLVERIFGRVEYIDWREFIIYAMDLPTPTQEDILRARDRFRMLDPDLKEIVTRDQYRSVPLWFFKYTDEDMPPETKYILHDDFRRSCESLFEEEVDFVNPNKLLGVKISEKVRDYVRSVRANTRADEVLTDDDSEDAEEALRLMLAKELLCQMYLIDRYSLNYTALLLAFCKDEDPREGLGKAFSFAIGGKVCTDLEVGEKYVKKLLEEKRLAAELESMRDLLREEALRVTEDILNAILQEVVVGVIIEEVTEEAEYMPTRRLMIENLDEPGEIDPSTLIRDSGEQVISDSLTGETDETERKVSSIMMHESYEEFRETAERMVIHWLPYDVCLTVLSATLPWHASQPDLFQTTKTLRELLRDAFDELYDEEVCDDADTVLSHRFLNHDFVTELLESTSKFTVKRLGNLFSEIINEKERNLRLV